MYVIIVQLALMHLIFFIEVHLLAEVVLTTISEV